VPDLLRPPPPMSWRDRGLAVLDTIRSAAPIAWFAGAAVLVAVGVVALLVAGRAGGAPRPVVRLPRADTVTTAPGSPSEGEGLVVHAAGAVVRPGVYRVPAGSRVNDVVNAAGGPAADADVDQLDLAAKVGDGDRVYVPRRGETMPSANANGSAAPAGPVDLNRATVEQLDGLPGVGPATAKAIVDWRTRHGRFRSVQDLLDVPGIGRSKLDRLEALVVVR
jgi:competence protein ComEA